MQNYRASIKITLREAILDVQGKAVEHALHSIEFPTISHVRIGKFVELFVTAENDKSAYDIVDSACQKLIANPIIEDYNIEISIAGA